MTARANPAQQDDENTRVNVEEAGRASLEKTFAMFSQMSSQLSESYNVLEARVTELKGQLALVSAQRMQELAEKERLAQRLQSLLDLLPGGVIVLDGQGVVREANPVACSLLGRPLVGMLWREVIARNFAPRKDDGHEISLKDGRRVSIATRSLDGEPGQLVLLADLTETRRLQDELARHERLSSLGRMVASWPTRSAPRFPPPCSMPATWPSRCCRPSSSSALPVASRNVFMNWSTRCATCWCLPGATCRCRIALRR